jgi:hypothetical protein
MIHAQMDARTLLPVITMPKPSTMMEVAVSQVVQILQL